MQQEYRDIGYIGRSPTGELVPVNPFKRSQVYMATHDGTGNRLSYMNRSFISFSYGGKVIEDFGLISVIEGNQIQRDMYAKFSDNITESNIFDGQIYWNSHYNANMLNLVLVTDGMTERQMDDFRHWFVPGKPRELILAEHPNRGIIARLAEPPVFSMLPFEEQLTTDFYTNITKKTSTTLYKGRIEISFIMDDPFWYSLTNMLDLTSPQGLYEFEKWKDANGNVVDILSDPDALKVILEDGVPCTYCFDKPQDATPKISDTLLTGAKEIFFVDMSMNPGASRVGSSTIGTPDPDPPAGAIIESGHVAFVMVPGLSMPAGSETCGHLYYPGTAPCYPKLSFTLTPIVVQGGYIFSPYNKSSRTSKEVFNTFTLEGEEKQEFRFSLPSIWAGYNQAITIFKKVSAGMTKEDLRALIRDNVRHWAPRNYAISVIDAASELTPQPLWSAMQYFLMDKTNYSEYPASFSFDGKTGTAIGKFKFRPTVNSETLETLEEDVGDMVKSKYLRIEERNYLDDKHCVQWWSEDNKKASHRFYHDVINGLEDVNLEYKYMYL